MTQAAVQAMRAKNPRASAQLKRYSALHDQRFDRAWWAFLLGCLGVFVSAFNPDGSTGSAWLILCGLSCMIVGRQQYARRLVQADPYADMLRAQLSRLQRASIG